MAEFNTETPSYSELQEENSRLRQENAELKEKLKRDKLTKFYKEETARNKTLEILRNYVVESSEPLPVSLILLDFDHFHRFNDYDHKFGNQAVVRFGEFIRDDIIPFLKERNYPTQGLEEPFFGLRFFEHGDEFGLVLCGVGLEEAKKIADDLQKTNIELDFIHQGKELTEPIKFSIGVSSTEEKEIAQFGESGETPDAKAKALYDELKIKAEERERKNKRERRGK